MESCEDDTEVESSDGSISPSSGSSDTELEDKPPDSSVSILASLESSDTNDDLIPPSSNDTEKREISTDAGILKSDVRLRKITGKVLLKLCWRLLCDIMLVIFIIGSVLGVVSNSNQPKIRASPRPRPFLQRREEGFVKDYYHGDIYTAFSDASQFENSLLMFYAPWDRESQEARSVLLELGDFFQETDLLVAAVNCWYPTSDCAKEFGGKSSGTRYPVFIFYPAHLKGIQYRGPTRADHLISWIQRCRYPLTHLLDTDHLDSLHTRHANLLVGYLPGLGANRLDTNSAPLLQCAHYLLESDPDTRVLVTSDPDLARSLHLHSNHPLKLLSWNATYSYPNKTIDSAKCNVWTLRHLSRPATLLQLPGRKSLILDSLLGSHSLLVLSPLSRLGISRVQMAVTEVAARYRDCNQTSQVSQLVNNLRSQIQKADSLSKLNCGRMRLVQRQQCQLRSFSSHFADRDTMPACQSLTGAWVNVTQEECDPLESVNTQSDIQGHVDDYVSLLIQESWMEKKFTKTYEDQTRDKMSSFMGGYDAVTDSVSGLACDSNRSVNIILVDTSAHGYSLLADSLGVAVSGDRTSLVLVSLAEESVTLVPEAETLTASLERSLLGWHAPGGPHEPGQYGLRSSDKSSRVQVGEDTWDTCSDWGSHLSCVREGTRDQWTVGEVTKSNVSVLLLYTSSYCSQCSVVSSTVHSVAGLLRDAGITEVEFRMLESTRNDPPLEWTALAYPSLMFIPAGARGGQRQTRLFPAQKEISVTSVLSFVLSNLEPSQRLRLALSSCDAQCARRLRLSASSLLDRLEAARRRLNPAVLQTSRGLSLSRRIRHVRTVLYVLAAVEEGHAAADAESDLPQSQSQRYYDTILDNFINN